MLHRLVRKAVCTLKLAVLLLYHVQTAMYALQEPGAAPAPVKPPPTDDDALDDSKFDEFMGSDAGAFASFGEYDQVCTAASKQALLASRAITPVLLVKYRPYYIFSMLAAAQVRLDYTYDDYQLLTASCNSAFM